MAKYIRRAISATWNIIEQVVLGPLSWGAGGVRARIPFSTAFDAILIDDRGQIARSGDAHATPIGEDYRCLPAAPGGPHLMQLSQ